MLILRASASSASLRLFRRYATLRLPRFRHVMLPRFMLRYAAAAFILLIAIAAPPRHSFMPLSTDLIDAIRHYATPPCRRRFPPRRDY